MLREYGKRACPAGDGLVSHPASAIDIDGLAGEPLAVIACKEHDDRCDIVVRISWTVGRIVREAARADDVAADVVLAPLACNDTGESADGFLERAVLAGKLRALLAPAAAEVDD